MTTNTSRHGQVYTSVQEYRRAYFRTEGREELRYDNPEEFATTLAKRHAEIVLKAVENWLEETASRNQES